MADNSNKTVAISAFLGVLIVDGAVVIINQELPDVGRQVDSHPRG